MSLRQALMGFFDRPSLSVGLFSGGSELRVPGYERQPLPRSAGEVRGRVLFGPFAQLARFDEIRLLDGDKSLDTLHRFSEALPLPPGAEFAHDLEIDVR